jgi:hypothetical protein
MFEGLAEPHSSTPQAHMGFRSVLYNSSLFFGGRCDPFVQKSEEYSVSYVYFSSFSRVCVPRKAFIYVETEVLYHSGLWDPVEENRRTGTFSEVMWCEF